MPCQSSTFTGAAPPSRANMTLSSRKSECTSVCGACASRCARSATWSANLAPSSSSGAGTSSREPLEDARPPHGERRRHGRHEEVPVDPGHRGEFGARSRAPVRGVQRCLHVEAGAGLVLGRAGDLVAVAVGRAQVLEQQDEMVAGRVDRRDEAAGHRLTQDGAHRGGEEGDLALVVAVAAHQLSHSRVGCRALEHQGLDRCDVARPVQAQPRHLAHEARPRTQRRGRDPHDGGVRADGAGAPQHIGEPCGRHLARGDREAHVGRGHLARHACAPTAGARPRRASSLSSRPVAPAACSTRSAMSHSPSWRTQRST